MSTSTSLADVSGRTARALLAGGQASFFVGVAVAAVLIVGVPAMVPDRFWLYAFLLGAVQLIAVVGLNLLVGHAGLISLGTAAFAMVGAYTVALTGTRWDWHPAAGAVAAVIVCVVVGVVTGLPALKLGPFAVAAVSLAYLTVASSLVLLFADLTGGGDGVTLPPGPDIENLWWVIASLAAVVFLVGRNVIRSPLGRSMRLAKLSPPLAGSLGVRSSRVKLAAFAFAAGTAGLMGAFYPLIDWRVSPEAFGISLSVLVLLMVIFGGEGSVTGPLWGAFALTLIPLYLEEVFAEGGQLAMLSYGVILLTTVLLIPRGLVGLGRFVLERLAGTAAPAASDHSSDAVLPRVERPAALEVQGIAKSLGGVKALRDASLSAAPGSVHGLIGPNGSGKTTLLNCISGLLVPDEGTLTIGGSAVSGTAAGRVQHGLARTFQAPQLVDHESLLANVQQGVDVHRRVSHVEYALRLPRARREAQRAIAETRGWLDVVGLANQAERPAQALPTGPRRLLEIVRALATHPRVVLLDEPAAGLAGQEVEELASLISMMRQAGITVVLVEHDTDLVMSLCDEITVLDQGVVIATGTPEEIRTNPAVIAAYLGQPSDDLQAATLSGETATSAEDGA